jgi:hypothetical protein
MHRITANLQSFSATGIKSSDLLVSKISCSMNRGSGRGSTTNARRMKAQKMMTKFGLASVAVSAMAAGLIGLAAPAQAAPTGPSNAEQTISDLQSQGYTVIVNRIGSAPLDQASVVSVRHGQTYTQTDSATPGDSTETRVLNKTVYVDVK